MPMKPNPVKVLFLSDTGLNKDLLDSFETNNIAVHHIGKTMGHLPSKTLFRHWNYFILAIKGVLLRKNYDVIFFWQQYIGYYYLFISIFFCFNLRPCLLSYVIYNPHKKPLIDQIKSCFLYFLLSRKTMKKAVFFSRSDQLFKKITSRRKVIIKLAHYNNYIENNLANMEHAGYLFSGGASNRDYKALADIASYFTKETFIVACTSEDSAPLKNAPNISFHTDAYGDKFSRYILNSKAVIIPLLDPDVVSGQLVVVQALQAGKIVFISTNNFLWDWVEKSKTKKFIIPYDSLEDIELLLKKSDKELAECYRLSRQYYLDEFSTKSMYQQLIDEIHTINTTVST